MKSKAWNRDLIAWLLVILIWVSPGATTACIWDRDTLRLEASQVSPTLLQTITGRFERFPPRYYEMRLEMVTRELEDSPLKLKLYDDAGVACDRLGRGPEAIEWMAKKKEIIDQVNDKEHQYRYHANLGTFLVHQWLRNGRDFSDLEKVKQARDHIAKAIEINPDAHFGREKYQLMAMDWILSLPQKNNREEHRVFLLPGFDEGSLRMPQYTKTELERQNKFAATEGISGLIFLGDGWNSVDIFNSLATATSADGNGTIAHMCELRAKELLEDGKGSLTGINRAINVSVSTEKSTAANFFRKARKEADEWQEARFSYMEQKFADGEHPDTHRDFWNGFTYRKSPPKPPWQLDHKTKVKAIAIGSFLVLLLLVGAFISSVRWLMRKTS